MNDNAREFFSILVIALAVTTIAKGCQTYVIQEKCLEAIQSTECMHEPK